MITDQHTRPDSTIPMQIAQAMINHSDAVALSDTLHRLTYGQLASCINRLQSVLPNSGTVAVFGAPSTVFGAATTACVVLGRPFVHLDPAMPESVLANIVAALEIDTVFLCQSPKAGQLPDSCSRVEVQAVMSNLADAPEKPVIAATVAPKDIIYVVATSGTTGQPKCIPVTHESAYLSYEWRDAYTPYDPGMTVGAYIFAIWEMFRPLRNGAQVCFPSFSELMTPKDLVAFLIRNNVSEMLFTPSALEKALQGLTPDDTREVPLTRVILNGEMVSDALIAAVQEKLPGAVLWNLYSICETHDIAISKVTGPQGGNGATSVGIPMPHIKAIVLDDHDRVCPVGTPGLLHFEGPRMLGPGYVKRPNETALRFREITLEGRETRLYDTGDQGFVAEDGTIYVMGRVAHMLKLRGHSIQTKELIDTMREHLSFAQAIPWIQDVSGQRQALVFYYSADATQSVKNSQKWGLKGGESRISAELSKALRAVLPPYCVPSYLMQLGSIPINPVSGKCDFKALPKITGAPQDHDGATDALPTAIHSAAVLGCPVSTIDPDMSFHDQGGDSLMAVNLLLALEAEYSCRVDFELALNVPLGRLHELLTGNDTAPEQTGRFDRKGILLTGATGFLGSRVLAVAAETLPADQVIYCVVRPKRRDPLARLMEIAKAQGVAPDRIMLVPAAIEDSRFGLSESDYAALGQQVSTVIHCAAMVNLAIDRDHMENWSQAGVANVLQFCKDASADLRFSSSTAVFPETGGPYAEEAAPLFPGCSGYGAAKIGAEEQIAASSVLSAIVRLPSLYDMDAPNTKDIYEIIMTACATIGAVPEGLAFRMISVQAAARFLVGARVTTGTRYFNLTPDRFVENADGLITEVPVAAWLEKAPLTAGEKALITADLTVLAARPDISHGAAAWMWEQITEQPFADLSDPAELFRRRIVQKSLAA